MLMPRAQAIEEIRKHALLASPVRDRMLAILAQYPQSESKFFRLRVDHYRNFRYGYHPGMQDNQDMVDLEIEP